MAEQEIEDWRANISNERSGAESAKHRVRCGGEESRGKSVREEEGHRKGSVCKSASSASRGI